MEVGKVVKPRGADGIIVARSPWVHRRARSLSFDSDGRNGAAAGQEECMKKVLALSLVAVFCAVVGLAQAQHNMDGKAVEGTISKVDMAGKTFVVKGADGKETTYSWNDTTKVQGTLKEGEMVHIKAVEKDGKMVASWVQVGKMEPKK